MQATDAHAGGEAFSVWALMTRRRRERPTNVADAFNFAPLPIIVVRGHELVIEAANEAAEGLAPGRTIGFALGEAMPEMAKQNCLTLLRDGLTCEFEQGKSFKRGQRRRWKVQCHRLGGESDGNDRMVMAFSDVTADAARLESVRRCMAKTDAGNRARDQFLAMLSDELRSPLAPIVSSLERIRAKGAHTREQAVIERQVRHLQRLVDDLGDIGGIVRGAMVLNKRTVEVGEIVAASIERVMPMLDKHKHRLDVRVPDGLAVVVDPDRMGQVLSNLIATAARLGADRSEISISARVKRGRVLLEVADRNIGIAKERLEDIFQMFVGPPQPAGSAHMAGLGLGLAIVRDVVRRHGGEVRARSKGLGHGSQFTVELPLATKPAAKPLRSGESPVSAEPTGLEPGGCSEYDVEEQEVAGVAPSKTPFEPALLLAVETVSDADRGSARGMVVDAEAVAQAAVDVRRPLTEPLRGAVQC